MNIGIHRTVEACLFLAVVASLAMPTTAIASKLTIQVTIESITAVQSDDSTFGTYYVLELQPPHGITAQDIEWAFLELVVDVSTLSFGAYQSKAAMIEARTLSSAFSGVLDLEASRETVPPSALAVPSGDGNRVVFDLTRYLRAAATNPEENHGVVVGAPAGTLEGVFSIAGLQSVPQVRLVIITKEP